MSLEASSAGVAVSLVVAIVVNCFPKAVVAVRPCASTCGFFPP